MSLTSSLFSGISGLATLGNSMQIIGDNIANVNTVGFKASSYAFQDLLSQATATQSGTSQIGRGTALADIYSSFEQGSFESTGNTTDLGIGGAGFFQLREGGSNRLFYTRAGNFRFDQNGYLINPEGYVVQGWQLDANANDVGSVTDIQLASFTSPPAASDHVTVISNLDSDAISLTADISASWDGAASPSIIGNNYEYQSTVKIYDSLGSTHDITIYYDRAAGPSTWEYIITCNPVEDSRAGFGGGNQYDGLLARGTIAFSDSSGTITPAGLTMQICDDPTAPTWPAATMNTNGYFTFQPDFIGGVPQDIEFDLGTRWDGTAFVNESLTSTQFARSSTTTFQSANGYGAGDFQGVDVDVDGVITGIYSNGQLIPLHRVALAKFLNQQELHKEGGNLYSETNDSGQAITNHPGTNGLGDISPNSLEQSYVDIANEFVKMITSQRGFQANSKIITTVDQMLAETIQMKR